MQRRVVIEKIVPLFVLLLGLVFIDLKRTDVVDWPWWWVLAPFWAIPVTFIVVFAGAMLSALIQVQLIKNR